MPRRLPDLSNDLVNLREGMEMIININGKMVSHRGATISVYDHGLLYGYGLYEGFRVFNGHIFLVEDHLQRVSEGMKKLNIHPEKGKISWEKELLTTLKANRIKNGIMRLTITGGNYGWKLQRKPYSQPNFFIFSSKFSSKVQITPKVLTVLQTPYHPPRLNYKSLNKINSIFGKMEIRSKKVNVNEGLFLTQSGEVAEGIDSNIFIIHKGEVITPPRTIGLLPGVTRQFVIKLAQNMGYTVREKSFSIQELTKADEIFLTSTGIGISPVSRIDNIYSSTSFPITEKLRKEYVHVRSYLRSSEQLVI